MPPGLIGSELSAAPSQYLPSAMEESPLFPPISRKSAISFGSESDPSDYCNQVDRKSQTHGSVPVSLSSTPLKFPTIDRANSTSIASLPGSRSTRHRSMTRDLRSSYCRSPSCPSNLNIRRDFKNDAKNFNRKENTNDGESNDSSAREDKGSLLPNIFSKDSSPRVDKSTSRREKTKDRSNNLPIRRTESFMRRPGFQVSEQNLPHTSREMEQRQGQATALLLPIRNTTQTNRKKKKRHARMSTDSEPDTLENTPRNFDLENNKSRMRYSRSNEDALDVIARENELYDDEMDTTRAIEISSSRKVKQWINNKHSHSESEIKA